MNPRLAALEATLEALATEFARRLVEAALRAPVGELSALLRDGIPVSRAPVGKVRGPGLRVSLRTPEREPVVVDDGDAAGSVITDPSLLLEVLGSGPSPAPRTTRRAATEEAGILGPSSVKVPRAASTPTLRAGERLQRTAGGSMVLRRGAK
jgi:hypothetical protein